MSSTQLIQSGGIQQVIAVPQIIYLDFDGELASYNGEILTVDEVTVEDSCLSKERIAEITAALNKKFAGENVKFVSDLSDLSDYSTIYIGKTSAFEEYGHFAGLAETVDHGNQNKSDKAFVMLDSTSDNAQIIETIAHEAGHLLGTLDHGGKGLQKYADYYVSGDNVSDGIVLSDYDSMWVCSGGRAYNTDINAQGYLYVYGGGRAYNTDINAQGYLYVESDGSVYDTWVNSNGSMVVSNSGTANNTTVNKNGVCHLSGGTANSITMSGGYLAVFSGGTANSITMSGGYLAVFSGGTANHVIWTPCVGGVGTEDGAVITYASTYSGIYFGSNDTLISSAMTMSGKIVSGCMYIMSGGIANNTMINSGVLFISSGGTVKSTTVNKRAMYVYSGGTASTTIINSDSELYVSSGGMVNNTTVNGSMHVYHGGMADKTTVNFNGKLYVSSGGTAYNIVWTPCEGHIYGEEGAVITYASSYSGVYFGRSETLLSWSMQMTGKTIDKYESMYIMSGGIADSTSVKNRMYILSGGIANSTAICSGISFYSGGSLFISNNGRANYTTVNGHTALYVASGGIANSTTVKGSAYFSSRGSMYVMSGGTANRTAVHSGGYLYVSSGGTANYVRWTPCVGVVYAEDGAVVTYASNYSGVYWGSGDTLLFSAARISSRVISGAHYSMYVMGGGTADNITNIIGDLYISSGGVANYTSNDGNMHIFYGGLAKNTTNIAKLYVSSGGLASSTNVASYGCLHVSNGGVADNTNMRGGNLYVYSGGTAKHTTISGSYYGDNFHYGNLLVYSGGTANDTNLNVEGYMDVYSGGMANSTTVNSVGRLYVISGGTANNTVVNSDGILNVGVSETYDAGESWGLERIAGGTVNYTTVYGGYLTVLSGGIANSTTVNSYGHLHVSSSGIANSTTVNSGGSTVVFFGGRVSGTMQIESGAIISAYQGAIIDFTVAEQTAAETALINDWSRISGGADANYTLTVKSDQADGTYVLADGATDFTNTITVKTTNDTELGTISAGETLTWNDVSYTLNKNGGKLNLNLKAVVKDPITITANSASKMYDGTELSDSGYTYTQGVLLDGDELAVTVKGSITDAGTAVNEIASYKVMRGETDVTASYIFNNSVDGTLTVTKRNITLTSESDSKVYDGTPLTNHNVTVSGDGFVAGEGYTAAVTGSQTEIGSSANTFSYTLNDGTKAGNYNITTQTGMLTVEPAPVPFDLQGTEDGISWNGTADAYEVEYSTDQFEHALKLQTAENGFDTFAMHENTYRWQVRNSDSETWAQSSFTATAKTSPESYAPESNGISDIFFANADGVWGKNYAARHLGCGNWSGTKELIRLEDRNKITDVFVGSEDANLLVLTDDANGDALFVDDIYSAFPAEQQSRFAQIDEIRAGAGDDIVDMTSQRFEYAGDGVTIRGGGGDDTLWSNLGDNKLFGDDGDDRLVGASGNDVLAGGLGNDSMHGGGGDDIFSFCDNWGTDTVEQLAGGTVTLWFENDSGSWNPDTMTYSDGQNSVKVTGVSSVTLKFGDDGTSEFDQLTAAGAFLTESSEKIFEEKDKGVIVKL